MLHLLFALLSLPVRTSAPAPAPPAAPVVVAELFTSQGCSSCPPADRLLTELIDSADGVEVLALSFHVDYWNYLGWADPFSDARFSERQRAYAARLRDRVYTPQLILNGRRSVIGSREAEVRRGLKEQAATPLPVTVRVERPSTSGDRLTVKYRTSGAEKRDRIHLALVERHLAVPVKRGENGGRTLRHDNVVRAFATVPAGEHGTHTLTIPADVDRSNAAVIAYVQGSDWAVRGAATVGL